LEQVRFIKDSQQLGFTLKEIKELLEIHESAKSFAGGKRSKSKEWEKAFRIAKERLALRKCLERMAGTTRLELATSAVTVQRKRFKRKGLEISPSFCWYRTAQSGTNRHGAERKTDTKTRTCYVPVPGMVHKTAKKQQGELAARKRERIDRYVKGPVWFLVDVIVTLFFQNWFVQTAGPTLYGDYAGYAIHEGRSAGLYQLR
jgi:DNA-binding transcriptional MerR regulator